MSSSLLKLAQVLRNQNIDRPNTTDPFYLEASPTVKKLLKLAAVLERIAQDVEEVQGSKVLSTPSGKFLMQLVLQAFTAAYKETGGMGIKQYKVQASSVYVAAGKYDSGTATVRLLVPAENIQAFSKKINLQEVQRLAAAAYGEAGAQGISIDAVVPIIAPLT